MCHESDSPREDCSIPFLSSESPEHQDAEADFQRETLRCPERFGWLSDMPVATTVEPGQSSEGLSITEPAKLAVLQQSLARSYGTRDRGSSGETLWQVNSTDHVGKDIGIGELEGSEDKAMAWEPSDPGLSHWDCVNGYRPDSLDATYNLAPMGIVWSLATDVVQYVGHWTGTHREQNVKGVSSAQHVLQTVYPGPAMSLQTSVDEQYEEMSFNISPKFNSTSSVSTTYITSQKGAPFGEDGKPYFNITNLCYTDGALYESHGKSGKMQILIDTGASKSICNRRWVKEVSKKRKLTMYLVHKVHIRVADSTYHQIQEVVQLTVIIQGHVFEVFALVLENMDPELDLILGSKSLFELEVTVNCERQRMQFLQQSVNAYVKYLVEVAASMSQTIDLTVPAIKDGQVKHWTPSRCLTKLDLSHGGDHPQKEFQTTEAFVDQDRTFQVTVTNDSAKDLILSKNFFVGGVDLRLTGYFFKDQDTLFNSFPDECAFLDDESTLNEMFAFLEKVNKLDNSAPSEEPKIDPDDLYPWLEKDDPRQTMMDMECIQKFINLDDSVLTLENKKHFQKILLKYKDAFSLCDEVGVCPYLKVHVEMKDKLPFFVHPYGVKEDQKKWVDKEMQKGCLLGYMRWEFVQQPHHAHSKKEFERAVQDSG